MNPQASISVILPTRNAGLPLVDLLDGLRNQKVAPSEIIVIDTDSSDGTPQLAKSRNCRLQSIDTKDFNHGGTRNRGAALASGAILVFMTQDAIPANSDFLQKLIDPILDGRAAACYARQIPHSDAPAIEVYARKTNYPEISHLRTLDQANSMGLRGSFFSNVASAISKQVFDTVGGFPDHLIMNEDMVLCSRVLESGHRICYAADAVVRHSHDYTLAEQFRRYFDIGVFTAEQGHLLPSSAIGGSGKKYALGLLAWLWGKGMKVIIPMALADLFAKWVGFQLGRRHHWLHRRIKRRLSMHRGYWA